MRFKHGRHASNVAATLQMWPSSSNVERLEPGAHGARHFALDPPVDVVQREVWGGVWGVGFKFGHSLRHAMSDHFANVTSCGTPRYLLA